MKIGNKLIGTALAVGTVGLAIAFGSLEASAHGFVQEPASRGFRAAASWNRNVHGIETGDMFRGLNWSQAMDRYGSIINEPQSVEGTGSFSRTFDQNWWNTRRVPDGMFGSAGLRPDNPGSFNPSFDFSALDHQNEAFWRETGIADVYPGANDFTWFFTIGHESHEFKYFITREGWDPNSPITNDDLELLARFDDRSGQFLGQFGTRLTHSVNIPADREGYHVVLAVWDIGDTDAAFYNLIDINIINDNVETPEVPELPEVEVPEKPEVEVPEKPEVEVPEKPEVEVPEKPEVEIPEVSSEFSRAITNMRLQGGNLHLNVDREFFEGNNRVMFDLNGRYQGEFHRTSVFSAVRASNRQSDQVSIRLARPLNVGDRVRVRLSSGRPGQASNVLEYKMFTVTEEMVPRLSDMVSNIHVIGNRIHMDVDRQAFEGNNRIMFDLNGRYVGEIHRGRNFYAASVTSRGEDTVTIRLNNQLNLGDTVRIRLSGGLPGEGSNAMDAIEFTHQSVPSNYPEWNAYAFYTVGDRVIFNGQVWEAIVTFQGHGDLNWAPGPNSTLWRLVE